MKFFPENDLFKPPSSCAHLFNMEIWRKKNRDHIIINQRWRWMLMRWWFIYLFYSCKCRTWTKILKRNFSLTANWPLNQLFLLRYANDREAERWLKLPFNSTLHCLTLDKKTDCRWKRAAEMFKVLISPYLILTVCICETLVLLVSIYTWNTV